MSVTVTTGTKSISILGDTDTRGTTHLYLEQQGQVLYYNTDGSSTFISTGYTMSAGDSITVDKFAAVDVVGSITTQGGNLSISTLNGVTVDNAPLFSLTTANPTGTLSGNGQTFRITGGSTSTNILTLRGTTAPIEGQLLAYAGTDADFSTTAQYAVHIVDQSNLNAIQVQLYQPIILSTSSSIGQAGNISMKATRDLKPLDALTEDPAPAITLGNYVELQAKGPNASNDGTITASSSDTITDTGILLYDTMFGLNSGNYTATVSVGQGAVINGGTVSLSGTAGDVGALDSSSDFTQGSVKWLEGIFNDLTALPLSVLIKSATAKVEVSSNATIDSSSSVTIASKATPTSTGEAIYRWPGIANFAISIAVDEATSDAESLVDNKASIDASGAVSITATSKTSATSTARVTQNTGSYQTNPNNIQISFAANKLDITTLATVSQGANITSTGGNVVVSATATDQDKTTVQTASYHDGLAGITGAIGLVNANVQAYVDGTIIAGGQNVGSQRRSDE
jgi:hypothetical protein